MFEPDKTRSHHGVVHSTFPQRKGSDQMKKRPTSVTVIAWILIVLGAISIIATAIMHDNPTAVALMSKSPLPVSIQYALTYFGSLVMVVSGVAMLMGHNWGRLLYVGWSVIGFVIGIITSPAKMAMIPGLVIFLILVFFLFRPKANEYFAGSDLATNA
jgi:hypothetical protein